MQMGTLAERSAKRAISLRRFTWTFLALSGPLLCPLPLGVGQSAGVNQNGAPYIHAPAGMNPVPTSNNAKPGSPLDQMREAERQRRLAADAAKLLDLSTQLKAQIDRPSQNTLPADMARKAAELEKTAHDLRQWLQY